MTLKRILSFLLLAALLVALLAGLYFSVVLSWSYSTGERAGWIQKLSKKGWVCKTWEGELALVTLPGTSTVEKFYFTVRDEAVADTLTEAMGKRVSLHYEEKVGLPSSCFGDTRHYITKVKLASELSLTPGGVVATGAVPAPAAASPPVAGPTR
jgi:hypothetical protein